VFTRGKKGFGNTIPKEMSTRTWKHLNKYKTLGNMFSFPTPHSWKNYSYRVAQNNSEEISV
jgi:hypothetical protein